MGKKIINLVILVFSFEVVFAVNEGRGIRKR